MKGLAERAFYRFPRGGQQVSGPSVHLARELARCWGNVQYGIEELRRDDEHGQSEMRAWAWDVQTNTRAGQIFIVPHKRDKQGGPTKLVDLRDIYENNANMGARRLREAIFAILPPWFTEEAKELCARTIEQGDGKPLEDRIAGAIGAFDAMGVVRTRLEQKLGRKSEKWTAYDVAQLRITHRSIERGEVSIDDEFPQARVTTDEITGGDAPAPAAKAEPDPTPPPEADPPQTDERDPTRPQMRKLFKCLSDIKVGDDDRHAWASEQLGRGDDDPITSFDELSRGDVVRLIDIAEATAAFDKAGES